MIRLFSILSILLFIVDYCYGQKNLHAIVAERYKTKTFEVAIFSESYNFSTLYNNRFTPTMEEIEKAENSLRRNLEKLNKDLIHQSTTPKIHENLDKYKRQYFGYIDKNGNRILLINCFWSDFVDFKDVWLEMKIEVNDGGSYFWRIKYNLNTEELFGLLINGNA